MTPQVEINKHLVLLNSLSSIVTHLINIFVLVWLHQYLLRRISTEEYSLYPVLMSVMIFVPLITTILSSGLGRYIVEAYSRGDTRKVTQIVSTIFPLMLGTGIILLIIGELFAWNVGSILTIAPERLSDARIMLGLLMFSAAIQFPLTPFGVGLYVRQKFVLQNIVRLCTELLRLGLLFTLLIFVSTRVLWVVVASVTANISNIIAIIVISRRLVPSLKFQINEIRWSMARQLTSYGMWSFVLKTADTIRTGADAIILNKLGTALDVTNFHLGSMLFRQIQQGSFLTRFPLNPALTAMHATGRQQQLRNTYLRGGRYSLWASLFISLPLIVYRKELITLYVGEKYLTAATVMALLLVIFPISYGNVMMSHIAMAKAQIRQWSKRAVVIHTTNLLLTLFLVGYLKMGAVGSALGTLTIYCVFEPLFYWPLGLKLANVDIRTWLKETIKPGLLPSLITMPALMILRIVAMPDTWLNLGICAFYGFLIYIIILLAFCMQPQDYKDMRQILAKIQPYIPLGLSSSKSRH